MVNERTRKQLADMLDSYPPYEIVSAMSEIKAEQGHKSRIPEEKEALYLGARILLIAGGDLRVKWLKEF